MTDGEKLIALQQKTGLTWKELAARVGIASAQTFTDIRGGRHGISLKLANRIIEAFPDIRREWLMFESGPMTNSEMVGFINMYESTGDLSSDKSGSEVADKINVGSCFPKAEMAVRYSNGDMVEYPSGCILVLRRVVDTNLLIPGYNYLVETEEFCVAKRVQKGSDDAHIALYSTSTDTYPDGKLIHEPFEIPIDSVRRIFSILGYIYPQSNDINKL